MQMTKIKFFICALIAGFGLSGAAMAQESFTLTIKDHKFDPAELHIPADKAATLVVKNLDATPEEFEELAETAQRLGFSAVASASFLRSRSSA